jgi:TonB family protein
LRDGHLEDIVVEKSSGVELLDRAAERALYLSDPLPPLPNTYPRDRGGVHLLFEYSDRY